MSLKIEQYQSLGVEIFLTFYQEIIIFIRNSEKQYRVQKSDFEKALWAWKSSKISRSGLIKLWFFINKLSFLLEIVEANIEEALNFFSSCFKMFKSGGQRADCVY